MRRISLLALCGALLLAFASLTQAQVEFIIQYDDGNSVYYSGRPRPDDTCGVWFEPPAACQIISGLFQFNDGMGGLADVYIWGLVSDFDPEDYFDNDEPGGAPGPSPLDTVIAGPISYVFINSGAWQEIPFANYGYTPADLDVGSRPFFLGYVLHGGGYYPSILGDAADDRPYHSLAWLTDPVGLYPNWSGWWAYGIDWMLRARVNLYGGAFPVITDLDDPPDTYLPGPYTITATILDTLTGLSGLDVIAQARIIYSVDGSPEDTVLMVNTGGNVYAGSIPAVMADQRINFRVEAVDDSGHSAIAPSLEGYYFSYLQPSGAHILLVNDAGDHDGEQAYRDALENGGYNYDFWYIDPDEPAQDMGYPGSDVVNTGIYSSLIWYNGTAHPGSLPDNDANLAVDPVANFMDDGGNFFLSSSDYLGGAFNPDVWTEFTAIPGTFMYDYLRVLNGWSDSHLDPFTGESRDTVYYGLAGDSVSGEFTSPFGNHPEPNYNDFANARPGAVNCFFTQIDDEPAGIRFDGPYKMVFLCWVLEACDDASIAMGILQNALDYFGETGGFNVSVTLIPFSIPIQIPANGGSFEFYFFATNSDSAALEVDLWTDVMLPDSSIISPLLGPVSLTLNPGTTGWYRIQNVPGHAPPGPYTYRGHIGSYPGIVWSQDIFPFTKLTTGAEAPFISDWSNSGDPLGSAIPVVPTEFALRNAYPNPFNASTRLTFDLPVASRVSLKVFNIQGQLVATLVDGYRDAGSHFALFDGTSLSSGLYFFRLTAGDFSATSKMVLLK